MSSKVQRPVELRESREVYWVRTWLIGQIKNGQLDISYQAAQAVNGIEYAQQFIARTLDAEQRRRLLKTLSARRARYEAEKEKRMVSPAIRKVTSEMTLDARNVLHAVATSRGLTTSDLILNTFGDEYDRLRK